MTREAWQKGLSHVEDMTAAMAGEQIIRNLTSENRRSLRELFRLDRSDLNALSVQAAAGLGDRILGFLVADRLDETGQPVGQNVQRYVSNAVLQAYLAIVHDVRCPGYNAHSVGDLFEALLKASYVKHGRSLDYPREVVLALIEFVDSGKDGVMMISPSWSGTPLQEGDLKQVLTRNGLLRFSASPGTLIQMAADYQQEMERNDVVLPPESRILPSHIPIPPPADSAAAATTATAAAMLPLFRFESDHAYDATRTTWCSRTGNSTTIYWFPCCGTLAVQDPVSSLRYSAGSGGCKVLLDGAGGRRHTGQVVNGRETRTQARKASDPAFWNCCRAVAVTAVGAPTTYVLEPASACSKQARPSWMGGAFSA